MFVPGSVPHDWPSLASSMARNLVAGGYSKGGRKTRVLDNVRRSWDISSQTKCSPHHLIARFSLIAYGLSHQSAHHTPRSRFRIVNLPRVRGFSDNEILVLLKQ